MPGVLSDINHILSEKQVNISGQYLQTNDRIGYVVIDVDEEYSTVALSELQRVKGTIRARVLF